VDDGRLILVFMNVSLNLHSLAHKKKRKKGKEKRWGGVHPL